MGKWADARRVIEQTEREAAARRQRERERQQQDQQRGGQDSTRAER